MEWNEIVGFFKKCTSVVIEYSILVIVTIASILMIRDRTESRVLLPEKMIPVTISGSYSVDDGNTFTDFDDYDDIDMRHLNRLIIKGHFDRDIKLGNKLYLFLNYIDATVYINDRIVYTSDPGVAYCWDSIDSYAFGPNDEVTIELATRGPVLYNVAFRQFLDRMTDSTKNAVLFNMLRHDAFRLIGHLLLIIIGILIVQTYVEHIRSNSGRTAGILSGAVGIMTGALTCYINADYITLILPIYAVLEYFDTLTQIFTVIFIMAYLRRYIEDKESKRRSGIILVVAYNIAIIYMLWRAFFVNSSFSAMIPVMAVGGIAAFYFIYLLSRDFKSHKENISQAVTVNSAILLASIIGEVIYFIVTGTYKIDMMEVGLIIFAIGQYTALVEENIAERREAARAKELENELMQSRINIMVSQIQPHFMYNALSTIRALVSKNPEEARKAIDFFTKYLRSNMDSLSQKKCIPFKKEMEHVESYLYIEKLRFGDMLNIIYDIKSDDFEIPCMTVQTLAENAVKHGLLARENGGTLKIRSRETANCYEVQIEDDGVGFDTSRDLDDSRSHVGIENSRKRLAAMCGGTLSIGSKIDVGTVITITIPKGGMERAEYDNRRGGGMQ